MSPTLSHDFTTADHTIILSDIHLADAEPVHEGNPLWKRFKRRKYFVDKTFRGFLEHVQKDIQGRIELILNGDIFDFDSVMVLPSPERMKQSEMSVNWIEELRGLSAEEQKSLFKIEIILNDHHIWLEALKQFIHAGNRVVFIIGNHDIELHWPSVQAEIIRRLELPDELKDCVRFCEWFYISNKDTLIEHGNQYDSYCVCHDPIHPLIKKGSKILIRIPFANMAGKLMINGIGLMNPHVESSFIKETVREYMVFFYTYMLRVQPFVPWSWLWSSLATLVISVSEGLLPSLKDPLMVEEKVDEIARKSNATPSMVRLMRELQAHPAVYHPFQILRELWLDRLLLLIFILFVAFQFYAITNVFSNIPIWWIFLPLAIAFPPFLFYAKSVQSDVGKVAKQVLKIVPLAARITHVRRIVQGHTHVEAHQTVEEVEFLNPGTWSPAYDDVECTKPYGRKCFVWIKPDGTGERVSELYEWKDDGSRKIS